MYMAAETMWTDTNKKAKLRKVIRKFRNEGTTELKSDEASEGQDGKVEGY